MNDRLNRAVCEPVALSPVASRSLSPFAFAGYLAHSPTFPHLQALWKRAMAHDVLAFTNMHLNMLVQVDVHARASGCILTPPPPALRLRMIHAAKLSKSAASAGEDEFSSLLTNMGFKHEREVSGCRAKCHKHGVNKGRKHAFRTVRSEPCVPTRSLSTTRW